MIIIILLIFMSNISIAQSNVNSIVYTDSSLTVNNVVLYNFQVKQEIPYLTKQIEDIKTLKKELHGFKFKRTKELKDQYCYYILNSGIEFQGSIDKSDLISLGVYFVKIDRSSIHVNNRFKTYTGSLKILNYEITNATKLGDFLKDPRFTYCIENSKASVAFKCRTPFECEIAFDGDTPEANITVLHFNL